MKMRLVLTILVAAVVLWMPLASAQDTVESIQKAVIEKWDGLKSMSGTFNLNVQYKIKPDMPNPLKLMGGGSTDYVKVDQTAKYRMNAWAGFSEAAKMGQLQSLFDGTTAYVDTLFMGKVDSKQLPASEAIAPGGKAFFDFVNQHVNLAPSAAVDVNGKACYALEGAFKEVDEGNPVGKIIACFDKETGVPMKINVIDKQGVEIGVITMTDVKINPEIKEEVFKYVPLTPPAPPTPPTPAPAPAAAPAAPAAAPAAK